MKQTDFIPKDHAFKFSNRFVNELLTIKRFVFWGKTYKIETDGRCGGMAYAALDYYFANEKIPEFTSGDFNNSDVPPDGHPLAGYISSRQMDSMVKGLHGLRDGRKFLSWTKKSTKVVLNNTLKREVPKVKREINRGRPVVLGLIKAKKVMEAGDNHQVVCYGYNDHHSGYTDFYIYDPNHPPGSAHYPSGEVLLSRRIRPKVNNPELGKEVPGDPSEPIKTITRAGHPFKTEKAGTWRGFFVQNYSQKPGFPTFEGPSKPGQNKDRPAPVPEPGPHPDKKRESGKHTGPGKPPIQRK